MTDGKKAEKATKPDKAVAKSKRVEQAVNFCAKTYPKIAQNVGNLILALDAVEPKDVRVVSTYVMNFVAVKLGDRKRIAAGNREASRKARIQKRLAKLEQKAKMAEERLKAAAQLRQELIAKLKG